jgi:hypothetical protein
MGKNKKQAAAIAAVVAYLRQEEEALAMQAMTVAEAPTPSAPAVPFKPWGVTGRQGQMQMRSLMELKAFHGWKLR